MRCRSYAMLLFVIAGVGAAYSQTPAPGPDPERSVFRWSFSSSGGYLGVQTEEINKDNFGKFGLREVRGVGVSKVVDGSPSQAAGLQNGDVIVKVNGDAITSSQKLTRVIGEIAPDHTARLTVVRNGSERDFDVTVGKRPEPKFEAGAFAAPDLFEKFDGPDLRMLEKLPRMGPGEPGVPNVFSFGTRRQIGVGLTPLTKQLSDHFGVTNGALVNTVREGSPAEKAGLKAGDVITQIDGADVKGEMDVVRALSSKKEGDVTVTVVRNGSRQTVNVTPEESKGGTFFEFKQFPPNAPDAPGEFKLNAPKVPMTPLNLNELFVPGRIV